MIPTTGPAVMLSFLLGAAFLILLRLLTARKEFLSPLSSVCNLILFYLAIRFLLLYLPKGYLGILEAYINTILLLALAWALIKLSVWVFFDLMVPRRKKVEVPGILKDLSIAILMIFALFIIIRNTLNINLASLIATSAVVSIILGLALQETLANMFAGLSIQVEKPYSIGEWISFESFTGQVEAINWRTTKLRTLTNDHVIVPNSIIAKSAVTNFTRPTRHHILQLYVGIHYQTPPNKAKEAILKSLEEDADVSPRFPPEIRLVDYGDFSIKYEVRFAITDFARHQSINDRIMTSIWYHLRRYGVTIPFPIRDVNLRTITSEKEKEEEASLLRKVSETLSSLDFLKPLSDEEIASLAAHVNIYTAHKDETIIRQGEAGDSCFIIHSGQAEVLIETPRGKQIVATLGPGQVFGEMSLMTGEERNATIKARTDMEVIIVSRENFSHILSENPQIAEEIGSILARRQMELELKTQESSAEIAKEVLDRHASTIMTKIRHFFHL